MVKGRKFKKKKLAPKPTRKKAEPVLSVNIIRKEYIDKVQKFAKRIFSFAMNDEQKTN